MYLPELNVRSERYVPAAANHKTSKQPRYDIVINIHINLIEQHYYICVLSFLHSLSFSYNFPGVQ